MDWSKTPLGPLELWSDELTTNLDTLFNSHRPMLLWWGPRMFQFCNDSCFETLGQGRDLAQGEEGEECWADIWTTIGPRLNLVYKTGEPATIKNLPVTSAMQNQTRPTHWDLDFSPIFQRNGTVGGVLAIATESVDAGKANESIEVRKIVQSAKESAQAAKESKNFFLSNMSHEIRAPLSAIIGFTELLSDTTVTPEERKKYLSIIQRNARALSSIINDVLDLSKIEVENVEINREAFKLNDIITEVLTKFSEEADRKKLGLRFESSGFPNFRIVSDPARVRQILVTLIGNAVKFTADGSIVLHGSYEMLGDEDLRINISITDTGHGLTRTQAEKLFRPFAQADGQTDRQYGGTGLGLAIARKVARVLGGDVTLAHSEQLRGCTFCFEFVASANQKYLHSPSSLSQPRAVKPLEGLKILVVDDSPDTRQLIELLLFREGAMVDQATNGEHALKLVRDEDYDAVLMDIQMPGIDGYATLARMREDQFKKPVFALTAYAMNEDRNRALQSGFNGHIPKPVNANSLVEALLSNTRRLH